MMHGQKNINEWTMTVKYEMWKLREKLQVATSKVTFPAGFWRGWRKIMKNLTTQPSPVAEDRSLDFRILSGSFKQIDSYVQWNDNDDGE